MGYKRVKLPISSYKFLFNINRLQDIFLQKNSFSPEIYPFKKREGAESKKVIEKYLEKFRETLTSKSKVH